jgi:hypothetical protein
MWWINKRGYDMNANIMCDVVTSGYVCVEKLGDCTNDLVWIEGWAWRKTCLFLFLHPGSKKGEKKRLVKGLRYDGQRG